MKRNAATLFLMSVMGWISTAVSIVPLHAQTVAFQMGQPPSPQTTDPARPQSQVKSGPLFIAPMASPIQPTANPLTPITGPVSPQQTRQAPVHIPGPGFGEIAVLPPGITVFVPAGTLVIQGGPDMQPGTFLSAPAASVSPSTVPAPAVPAVPASPATPSSPPSPVAPSGARGRGTSSAATTGSTSTTNGPQATPDVSRLALGTTREKVIEKYGNPIAFIMNMNGETLYFNNGVVVFLRDGVVAVPAIPGAATRP